MSLGMYFAPTGFTTDKYEEALRRLEAAGAGSPPGRQYHCALKAQDGSVNVFDVWDSHESFDRFGETLLPIMSELGTDPGEPMVMEVHNVILGS
jgi:hypothetical protein